eukprot:TRINITY_DN5595_c0_g6_i1.p1 TRINITY_DN5595_c0_g6~~TRINITY_DN5595_c0_g6_i1.p1  ORF type:complete len:554 (+),score=108.01 TRINITY_DN5595_c0_g6_i1:3-1664(+)
MSHFKHLLAQISRQTGDPRSLRNQRPLSADSRIENTNHEPDNEEIEETPPTQTNTLTYDGDELKAIVLAVAAQRESQRRSNSQLEQEAQLLSDLSLQPPTTMPIKRSGSDLADRNPSLEAIGRQYSPPMFTLPSSVVIQRPSSPVSPQPSGQFDQPQASPAFHVPPKFPPPLPPVQPQPQPLSQPQQLPLEQPVSQPQPQPLSQPQPSLENARPKRPHRPVRPPRANEIPHTPKEVPPLQPQQPQLQLQQPQPQSQPQPQPPKEENVRHISGEQHFVVPFAEITLLNQLGTGGYGVVFKGVWRNLDVAVKTFKDLGFSGGNYKSMPIQHLSDAELNLFFKEVELMSRLRHPNLVQFLAACIEPTHYCILTEFMENGNLHEFLNNPIHSVALTWKLRLSLAEDMTKGLAYLHLCTPPIVHRDIKSLNVLVDSAYRAKLSDFGMSKALLDRIGKDSRVATTFWIPPEVMMGEQYSVMSDIYSLGLTFWELATGKYPGDGKLTLPQVLGLLYQKKAIVTIPPETPPGFAAIIHHCINHEPSQRPTASEILRDLKQL